MLMAMPHVHVLKVQGLAEGDRQLGVLLDSMMYFVAMKEFPIRNSAACTSSTL